MGMFWDGYLAGLITVLLPSITYLVVAIQRAPILIDGRTSTHPVYKEEARDASSLKSSLPDETPGMPL